jgi:hypothetical protein
LLHAICTTAVRDGLLPSNPCQISRAMNPPRKREPVILDVKEIAAVAESIQPRYRALVLIGAWCGLRWGEIIELRRKDISAGCEIISVARAAHFCGTRSALCGNLVEVMNRLGHSTVKASLIYQQMVNGRDAEVAVALSELAE